MSQPKNFFVAPKKLFLVALVSVFVWHRADLDAVRAWVRGDSKPLVPAVDVTPASLTPAERVLFDALRPVTRADRTILADFYAGMARSIQADPSAEPVFTTVSGLRRVHRAGVLFMWRGMAGNEERKYDGLGAAIEGVLTEAIGDADVQLNPAIRQKAVQCFNKMSALCATAKK